jgi:CRP-like cAMP-binding protein
MSTAELPSILRGTDLFRSVPAEDFEAVAEASRIRVYRRGQVVCTAGQPGDTVIVVVSGRLKVVVRSADGGERTLTVVQPGGVFGELAAVDGGPRSADAETLEESRLLLIPRKLVQDICARVPAVCLALARSLAATLRRLTEGASDLVFLDLPRGGEGAARPAARRGRPHPAEDDPGAARASGRRHQGERQRRAARLRATRLDRAARPGGDGQAGGVARPVRQQLGARCLLP